MWFLQSGVSFQSIVLRIIAVLIIVFFVLPLHECAHGFIANKLGDKTAKYSGRLTLNPIPHIDPIGAIGILLFGFGWAKPVPVDPRNFKNPKSGMAITALAGPVSNLLAAMLGGFIVNAFLLLQASVPYSIIIGVGTFFAYYISINVGLAVFNLLPIPPLDGSKIFAAFIPDRILYKYAGYQNVIMLVVFVLLLIGVLSWPLSILQNYLYYGVMWFTKLPFKLFV